MPLRHVFPLEVQAPVETAPDQRRRRVLESVSVDYVDDRRHDRVGLLLDARQHRLQPFFVHFDVAVEKHDHLGDNFLVRKVSADKKRQTYVTGCFAGAKHSRSDQPLSTRRFGYGHNGQIFYAVGHQLIVNIV